MSGRVQFACDGEQVEVDAAPGETLLSVLRERLGITSVKDGCAPQGQCGCCTVLVDGAARVACVTPVARIAGRSVTTVDGLPSTERDALADAFVADGRLAVRVLHPRDHRAGGRARGPRARSTRSRSTGRSPRTSAAAPAGGRSSTRSSTSTRPVPRAVRDARRRGRAGRARGRRGPSRSARTSRSAAAASPTTPRRGTRSSRSRFHPAATRRASEAAGFEWVVAETLHRGPRASRRRCRAGARRWTPVPPLPLAAAPDGGVRLATSWVEPAYLEPDASWCEPGGRAGDARSRTAARSGARPSRPSQPAARELADRLGRTVRVAVLARGRRPPRAEAPTVRRRARCSTTGSCRSTPPSAGEVRAVGFAHPSYDGYEIDDPLRARVGPGPADVDRAPCRRLRRAHACSRRAHSTRPASTAPHTCAASRTRRCSSTTWSRSPRRRRDGRRARHDRSGHRHARAGRGARRRRRPARRGRAAVVRDRRRAHGARAGCSPRGSRSIPRPARCTTSPSARSA